MRFAKPSTSAQTKQRSHQTADGFPAHSFRTLPLELASRAKVTYEMRRDASNLTFRQVLEPTPRHARAYERMQTFPVTKNCF